MNFRYFILFVVLCICTRISAQFELISSSSKSVSKWYVKNNSSDSFKLKSITLRFFHHTGDIVFTPSITNPGGGKYQFTGTFYGQGNHTFQYKTIQIAGLNGYILAGDTVLVSITENAGNRKDSVIAAGVHIYYADTLGNDFEADIYPSGSSACPSAGIFVNAGNAAAGIKYGSFASPSLHPNPCETQLVAIVYSNSTLSRKGVTGVTPHCASGRLWTDYGWPKNEQIYYSFDITTGLGRLQFDTLINAMNTGDYIALTNAQILPLSNFNFIKTSLKKIGFDPPTFSDVTGYLTLVGKKSAVLGEANYDYCQDSHGNCYVSIEQSIVQGNVSNGMQDFAPCYESTLQILTKTDSTINKVSGNSLPLANVFPNPTQTGWNITPTSVFDVKIYDLGGRLRCENRVETATIIGSDLPIGNYILHLSDQKTGEIQTYFLLKE